MANDSSSSILKNTSLITLATLGSRITGLLRTWAMAFALGNTLLTSAYQIAYNLPSMIYDLAVGGVLATAFLPLYLLQKEREGDKGAQKFSSNILSITLIILGVLALLCSIFAPAVIETQTFTVESGSSKDLSIFFFRVFAIQILFYGLGAVITGILNAERVFLIPSLAPVMNNVVVIVTMFGFVPLSAWNADFAMWWLAIGTSLGVLVQFGIQIPALIKRGFKYSPHVNLHDPMLKEALKVALPMFIYIAGTMITFSCRNAFSLDAAANGPSTLNYAWTWYQLPYGIIAVSVSTTMLTELSDCAAREDWRGFKHFIKTGLRSTFFLIIPLAAMVGGLALPLMQLFQAGAFSSEDTLTVSMVLSVWTLSLPFYAGYMYMYRVFAALRKFTQFALIDIALRIVQVFFYYLLCQPNALGVAGIPVADIFFYVIMFAVCVLLVKKHVGDFGISGTISLFFKVSIASIIGGVIVVTLSTFAQQLMPSSGASVILFALLIIAVAGSIGLVVSFALCKLFKISEYEILSRIGKKVLGMFRRGSNTEG